MSLQLWLPLNGDFINYGLAPGITIINNENRVIFANEGRINTKSAYFDTSYGKKTYLKTNYAPNIGTGNFSIAFWIKISSDLANSDTNFPHIVSTKTAVAANLGFAVIYQKSNNTIGLRVCNGSNSNNQWAKIANVDFSNYFNLWMHIILIRDNNRTKNGCAFVNGILYDYDSSVSALDAGNKIVYIGDVASDSGYYPPLPMYLSDLRIYDHALSDKEAKELYKSLILHYKLNETSNWLLDAPEKSVARKSSNQFIDYNYYEDLLLSTDTIFNVGFLAKGSVNNVKMDIYFRSSEGSSYAITSTVTLTSEWKLYNLIINGSPENLDIFRVRCLSSSPSGSILYIRNVVLTSANMPIRQTEIKDVSGYGNDGLVIGAPIIGFNSKRYEYYIHLDAGLHIRVLNRANTFLPTQALTVNAWVRYSTSGSVVSCTQVAGMNLYPTSFSVYIGSSLKKKTVTAPPVNEWHMLTGVFDGTLVNYYRDGVKIGNGVTANGTINYTNNSLFIGAEASSGTSAESSNHIVGDISDVRIYATALTQEDIQELYQTSASIDNKSNIYSREFIEDNNKISIQQNGQLLMDAVEEDSSTASLCDTKVVKGQLIYEY